MKKLLVILLLMVYGLSSTGATLHLHYCCGKLDKVALSQEKKSCAKDHKAFAKACCKDRQLELKIKSDHKIDEVFKQVFGSAALAKPAYYFSASEPVVLTPFLPQLVYPPLVPKSPLYIFYCVYRI